MLSGPPAAVADMLERLRRGPESARVMRIVVAEESDPPPLGFAMLPTV
jgi:hypothetical protein